MGKKQAGENSKKVSGNAKKAEAANQKAAAENAKKAVAEDQEWSKGSKSTAKKDEAEQKKQDLARKKAEKEALLAEEDSSLRTQTKSKAAPKKTRGLDLSQLDPSPSTSGAGASTAPSLNATGIDNALDALSLTTGSNPSEKVDRHPERRFKAAYAAFEARRLREMEEEHTGLRRQQRIEAIRKEFERSDENPFNQISAKFDSSKEEVRAIGERERGKIEQRLGGE